MSYTDIERDIPPKNENLVNLLCRLALFNNFKPLCVCVCVCVSNKSIDFYRHQITLFVAVVVFNNIMFIEQSVRICRLKRSIS